MPLARTRRLRPSLTFSNVVSLLALFVALGGSAYAAGVLPPNSVGRSQLQANSVTRSKLAPNSVGRSAIRADSVTAGELASGSVGLEALDPTLRTQLTQRESISPTGMRGDSGTEGPRGPEGPSGQRGPAGPGAVRMHFSAQASASPIPQSVVAIEGLHLDAACEDSKPGTQLNLSATTAAPATFYENINVDSGPAPASFGAAQSANLQIGLPGGTTTLGGPSVASGEYNRIFAHLLYIESNTTVELTILLMLDGSAGTCSMDGVAVPAAS